MSGIELGDKTQYGRRVQVLGGVPLQFCTGDPALVLQPSGYNTYLTDEVYRQLIDKTVIGCVDIVFYYIGHNDEVWVFLPKRINEPHPATWVVGGRRRAFATLEQAADINASREVGWQPDTRRFEDVPGDFDLMWDSSTAAGEHLRTHSHTRTHLLAYRVTVEERDQIVLDPRDYLTEPGSNDHYWYRLREMLDEHTNIHPALRAMLVAFRDRNSNFKHVHTNAYLTTYEALHRLDGSDDVTFTSIVTALQDEAIIGNCSHPQPVTIIIQSGRGTIRRQRNGGTSFEDHLFHAGEAFVIRPFEAHALRCVEGTVVVTVAGWEPTPSAVINRTLFEL